MGTDILSLTAELCAFRTGVVAEENEPFFERVARELPLSVLRVASGETHNGWIVPELWRVHEARIERDGRTVHDATEHPLGVAVYSRSFDGELELADLRQHLVTSPDLPSAWMYHCMWQYRPWAADWALSIPYERYATLEAGPYHVRLETSYGPGEMLIGECELPGETERTIVFNAHTCHPGMANDDFAGVAVLVRLFQWLRERPRFYTYRLVLAPEHLGTVFYLRDVPAADVERLVCGAFADMPGTQGAVTVASTFLGGQRVDLAFRNAARSVVHRFVPWRQGAGNDETVWEAPGYEVPFVEVSRSEDLLAPFRGYHTSLDTPTLLEEGRLAEYLDVFKRAVDALERDARAHRRFDGLVCLSNPAYDLYQERPDPAVDKQLAEDSERWGYLVDCLPRYLDGSLTLLEIAERHELPFDAIANYLQRFEDVGLVELERAPVERPR